MEDQYSKLFRSITTSTVWMQSDSVRIVWITLLALKDKDGNVWGSVPGLANVARVKRAAVEKALAILEAPDPDSRTKDHDGRRILAIDGGWHVLNHDKYRNTRDNADRSEYERTRKAQQRQQLKEASQMSGTSPDCPGMSANTDTDTDTDTKKKNCRAAALPDWLPRDVWADFVQHRKKLRAAMTPRAEDLTLRKLERFKHRGIDPISCLETSIENGWRGVFEPGGANGKESHKLSAAERVRKRSAERIAEIDAELARRQTDSGAVEPYGRYLRAPLDESVR
ncbi:MAG TPA: hypothetical protein VNE18_10325 [Rhodanobacter sp.]|nr:hypothetical protein [Rhodanobacter sp.]